MPLKLESWYEPAIQLLNTSPKQMEAACQTSPSHGAPARPYPHQLSSAWTTLLNSRSFSLANFPENVMHSFFFTAKWWRILYVYYSLFNYSAVETETLFLLPKPSRWVAGCDCPLDIGCFLSAIKPVPELFLHHARHPVIPDILTITWRLLLISHTDKKSFEGEC